MPLFAEFPPRAGQSVGGLCSLLSMVLCLALPAQAAGTAPVAEQSAAAVPAAPIQPAAPVVRAVSLVKPRFEQWSERVDVQGNVMPWQEIRINTDTGGLRLTSVQVNIGDSVTRGQTLAQLDTTSVEAELASVNAQLVEAEATFAQADATLSRANRLATSGGVSKQELTQYETQKQTAGARLAVAQARVKTQQIKLATAKLVAPDDGVISARFVDEGDIVRSGSELFRLIRQGKLEWHAEVPGETLLRIDPGQEAVIISPLGDEVRGHVRRISPTIDIKTRTGLVYVELPASARFKAGLLVSGSLTIQRRALVLPAKAVQQSEGNAVVFTVGADNKAQAVPVKLGRSQDGKQEVLSGVNDRSRVIQDATGLQAGVPVKEAAGS
ncbi:MAG: hypothetical protein BSR46_02540 [Candidatus Dactylopiibacterium carminicum]|nr:efflux RND transporter periplasmic adaptor subunit [Candidatus Dactylopiibacterium carminicum]PAT00437.1 MAG: hypothetical protein BSR46_02540 [Candidatus Dactylopiibacterium carminicum]